MTLNYPPSSDDTHDEVVILLPWYVNGTLEGEEWLRVKRHVKQCPACRHELAILRALVDRIIAAPVPDRSAQAYARLRDILSKREATPGAPARRERTSRNAGWRSTFVRDYVIRLAVAVAVLLVLAPLERQQMDYLVEPSFRTLSDRPPAAEQGDLRLVFDKSVDAPRIEALLKAIGGRRVGKPGPGGVYTIRLSGQKVGKPEIEAAMAYLRQQEGVLLVEPIRRD
jgi:hypothetical protein